MKRWQTKVDTKYKNENSAIFDLSYCTFLFNVYESLFNIVKLLPVSTSLTPTKQRTMSHIFECRIATLRLRSVLYLDSYGKRKHFRYTNNQPMEFKLESYLIFRRF